MNDGSSEMDINPLEEFTTAGRKARAEREEEERLAIGRQRLHMIDVVRSVPGRAVLWGIIEDAGVLRQSMSSDPHATSFNEGRRSVGLKLLAECQSIDPGFLTLLLDDAKRVTTQK